MPLYKIINHSIHTTIYVWRIEETSLDLFDSIVIADKSVVRLSDMKSDLHRRGFLSVRMLLQEAGYNDNDLSYDDLGKPHLSDGKHISITHSHHFSAIVVSDVQVGIDMEKIREKIAVIAPRFMEENFEFPDKKDPEYIKKLTALWGVKECIFKIRNEAGISFRNHIKVDPFDMLSQNGLAHLHFQGINQAFQMHFVQVQNFMLVYAFEKEIMLLN
ncbi:4'-phosphopantetheinyl transferase family protein [Flavobacterium ardleyense]|uniref:4'-phosphopantetheinyl transferase family protein n=1 Tax=Flavobacterium ardleyense TaxID=2038737 RepID=UPI00298CCEC5|nr:4-phosphopantetheinyl transferase [Flavobacterium ardleyense]